MPTDLTRNLLNQHCLNKGRVIDVSHLNNNGRSILKMKDLEYGGTDVKNLMLFLGEFGCEVEQVRKCKYGEGERNKTPRNPMDKGVYEKRRSFSPFGKSPL